MKKFLIRNDDVAFDTDINELRQFCEVCDRYGYKIIQSITLMGEVKKIRSRMTNDQIKTLSARQFGENHEVLEYLKSRDDLIGVHGLWHTHSPNEEEIKIAKNILQGLGLAPTYFIPPFNEGDYPGEIAGLKTSKLSLKIGERLEDFLEKGNPRFPIMYLHSWRFNGKPYTFDTLSKCLQRLESYKAPIKLNLGSKHRKMPGFDNLDKIFGWMFQDGLSQYADSSVEGITISHALMFLTTQEIETFAKEMWRVLKNGGVVRITEDDTENAQSAWYKTGNIKSGPNCLTGPEMMRKILERQGFSVYDVDQNTTHFSDRSLMQAYRGGAPNVFFIEAVKTSSPLAGKFATLKQIVKKDGGPKELAGASRRDLPEFFKEMGFKTGAEIGVAKGKFTEAFCKAGFTIFAIDPWLAYGNFQESPSLQIALDSHYQEAKKRLEAYPNCSIIKKSSMDALSDFADGSLDFVYIDGNHEFKHIAQDVSEWAKKVRKGGVVSGHDYTFFSQAQSKSLLSVCHVVPVVNAYTEAFEIKDFFVLGRRFAPINETRDRWRSWMFLKP